VAQPMHEGTAGAVGVDAGAAKSLQHPGLQGAAGDPVAIGTHEQRRGQALTLADPMTGGGVDSFDAICGIYR
jgi:hypothetical protein